MGFKQVSPNVNSGFTITKLNNFFTEFETGLTMNPNLDSAN